MGLELDLRLGLMEGGLEGGHLLEGLGLGLAGPVAEVGSLEGWGGAGIGGNGAGSKLGCSARSVVGGCASGERRSCICSVGLGECLNIGLGIGLGEVRDGSGIEMVSVVHEGSVIMGNAGVSGCRISPSVRIVRRSVGIRSNGGLSPIRGWVNPIRSSTARILVRCYRTAIITLFLFAKSEKRHSR